MKTTTPGLIDLYKNSLVKNSELKAFSDYNGDSFTYHDVARRILLIHGILQAAGVGKGDKIALFGKNSSSWAITYLAVQTYGAVIVPILPDFKPVDVQVIINHSDSVLVFADDFLYKDLKPVEMPDVRLFLKIQDLSILHTSTESVIGSIQLLMEKDSLQKKQPLTPDNLHFAPSSPDDLAVISYTSGTTGFSKGVMLQHKSLCGNILYAQQNMPLNPRDKILSFLPLAHTYGCAFEFLFPFTLGCDITFLTKTPSPKIILQAFQEIKPSLILSVPLVIEKIYKTQIIPVMRKIPMKILTRAPLINRIIFKKIKEKLFNVFGGNFRELVIGGAAFNTEAERFFKKIGFPFTVG
ncbi:MAG: AMP-binding protein, partial [Syntrophothermus sp.]